MLHSGIDLHKRTIAIATVTPDGQPVRDTQLPTSRPAIRAYFASMPGPHRAVVESTSNWYWLRDLLVSVGVDLRLGHSKYIKAISYAKVKTDAVDAATLRLRPTMHEITLACLLALSLGENSARSDEILSWFRESVWTDLRSWKPWTGMSRLRPRILAAISSELDRLSAAPT